MSNRKCKLACLLVLMFYSAGILTVFFCSSEFDALKRKFVLKVIGFPEISGPNHGRDVVTAENRSNHLQNISPLMSEQRERSISKNISDENTLLNPLFKPRDSCIIPEIDGYARFGCAADDSEGSWGPILQHNLETMALEDSKPGEAARSFMLRGFPGECGTGCLDITLEKHTGAYSDLLMCNRLARNISNSRYCSPVIFHTYWASPPVPPQVPLYVVSFLTTQDLEFAQLWIWSRKGISLEQDPRMSPFLGHPNIQFRQYSGADIVQALNSTSIPETLFLANDAHYWLETDLFRVLILHTFGGIYTDMDFLYLRNFGPILGQEWLYQWGSHCVDMNGAVMRLFARSDLGRALLEHILSVPPQAGTTAWGRDTYRAVSRHTQILRYPSCFFNPTWLTGHDIYKGGTHRNSWHGAFGFHLHGPVFSKGPLAEDHSDYASVVREICTFCKHHHEGGLPRMSSALLNQSFSIHC